MVTSSLLLSSSLLLVLLFVPPFLSSPALAQNSRQDYLDAHNKVRAEVGEAPLTWDDKLEQYALNYAKVRTKDCALIHSGGPYGENIYYGEGQGWDTAVDAINWWCGEKKYYDHDTNTCQEGKECLHYTQIVWRNTTKVGCARLKCDNGEYFTTCNYYPPGNYQGVEPY